MKRQTTVRYFTVFIEGKTKFCFYFGIKWDISWSVIRDKLSQAQRILTGRSVKGVKKDDRKELLNYKEAMDFVSEYLGKKLQITEYLIKYIHRILVKDVRGGIR